MIDGDENSAWEDRVAQGEFGTIPDPFLWKDSSRFAHMINGYEVLNIDRLGSFTIERERTARRTGAWEGSAAELWLCLFYEHRAWREEDHEPVGDTLLALNSLCATLRAKLVEGPQIERDQALALIRQDRARRRPEERAIRHDASGARSKGLALPGDLSARSFKSLKVVERRRASLESQPEHMVPLIDYLDRLRAQKPGSEIPDFDPAGGGVNSSVLFLFEKPGPGTARNGGSGFLSPCNNDPTAQATHHFCYTINDLSFQDCLFANVIPWWDGDIKISAEQRKLAGEAIPELLSLLPDLRQIVIVGRTARAAWKKINCQPRQQVKVRFSLHPSPRVRASHPIKWALIPAAWPTSGDLEDREPGL